MFKFVFVVLAIYGSALAFPLHVEDEFGQQYVLVPIEPVEQHRVRRQAQTDYSIGTDAASISHQQTLINNQNHRLDGKVFAEKQFVPNTPLTAGGNLDYLHKPSSSVLSVGASNTRGLGTDFSASGQYNFLKSRDGRGSVGAYGQYDRHFGGPSGTSSPDWQAGIRAKYNF